MSAYLFDPARRELEQDSGIAPDVIAERGYESIHRPTNSDKRQRERLRHLGIPTWATKEDSYFPGLLIPMYGPTGARVSCQWKPHIPVSNRDGKKMKYASPRGQTSRLDVHFATSACVILDSGTSPQRGVLNEDPGVTGVRARLQVLLSFQPLLSAKTPSVTCDLAGSM
jgi:hypothetical protein